MPASQSKSRPSTGGAADARSHRGDCPTCGKGVYSDEPRTQENGSYYHEDCTAASKAKAPTQARADSAKKTGGKVAISKETAANKSTDKAKAIKRTSTRSLDDPTLRGECPECGKGVYSSDQPRTSENGSYYHEDCLGNTNTTKSANASRKISADASPSVFASGTKRGATTPRADAPSHRGDCPICGEGVYSDQKRSNENGAYYHEDCLAESNSKSTAEIASTPDAKKALENSSAQKARVKLEQKAAIERQMQALQAKSSRRAVEREVEDEIRRKEAEAEALKDAAEVHRKEQQVCACVCMYVYTCDIRVNSSLSYFSFARSRALTRIRNTFPCRAEFYLFIVI